MVTSWPSGSALGRPRKRRKRPVSRASARARRADLVVSQVVRKLTRGREFNLTVPRSASAPEVRELKCCARCGGPLAGAFLGEPVDGKCASCASAPETHREPVVRRVGAVGGKLERSRLVGEYRPILTPAEASTYARAGARLSLSVRDPERAVKVAYWVRANSTLL